MALFLRPAAIVLLALAGVMALREAIAPLSTEKYERAHRFPVVLFGDSHAGDVALPGVPRFSTPAQDLVSTYFHMRAFAAARPADSHTRTVLLTIWPDKFGPIAEARLQEWDGGDGWVQSALGMSAPVLRFGDLFTSELPLALRGQFVLQSAQLRRIRKRMGYAPNQRHVPADYQVRLSAKQLHEPWFEQASVSRWAFARILELADEAGWNLILIEHPLHSVYFPQLNEEAVADYASAMQAADSLPGVHYLALGRDSLAHTAFVDHHHLSEEGAMYVRGPLLRALDAVGSEYVLPQP